MMPFKFETELPLRARAQSIYASGARTVTPAAAELVINGHRGLEVAIQVTAGATLSLTVTIDIWDEVTGAYLATTLTSAALTGTGTTRLLVYPGATVAANVAANAHIRNKVRVTVTHGNANSATYQVDATLLP